MKFLILILSLFLKVESQATELTVLNFNTMCDFCHGSDFFSYEKRQKELMSILEFHSADLMSLQELRTIDQVKAILPKSSNYGVIATDSLLMSYADPAIVYNKDKLKLISSKNYWLGPNHGDFSLGWKKALPRQLLIAEFEFEGVRFHFLSSHFDNLRENLKGSIGILNKIASELKGPILFAGDTNIPLDMKIYKEFSKQWKNAFDEKESFQVLGTYQNDKDICYLKKGKVFPICRVEHFLIDKKFKWNVNSLILDARKNKDEKFSSDHRPYVLRIKLPKDAPKSSSLNQ